MPRFDSSLRAECTPGQTRCASQNTGKRGRRADPVIANRGVLRAPRRAGKGNERAECSTQSLYPGRLGALPEHRQRGHAGKNLRGRGQGPAHAHAQGWLAAGGSAWGGGEGEAQEGGEHDQEGDAPEDGDED